MECDSRWTKSRHLVRPIGRRACCASPILDAAGEPVGTFAFYYRECRGPTEAEREIVRQCVHLCAIALDRERRMRVHRQRAFTDALTALPNRAAFNAALGALDRSEEHTSELQSLMRTSYAVFCLKKKKKTQPVS